MRGDVRGVWINGRARICEDDEAARGQQLLTQKYGLLKIVGDFFSRLMRHKQTVIVVGTDGRDQPATPMTRIDGLRLFRN